MTDVYGQTDTEQQLDPSLGRRTRLGRSHSVSGTHRPSILKDPTRHLDTLSVVNEPPILIQQLAHQKGLSHAIAHGLKSNDLYAHKQASIPFKDPGHEPAEDNSDHMIPRTTK